MITSTARSSTRTVFLRPLMWTLLTALPIPAAAGEDWLNAAFLPAAQAGAPHRLAVHWDGPPGATLSVWLDENGDGVWQERERIVDGTALIDDLTLLGVEAGSSSLATRTRMRLRASFGDGESWVWTRSIADLGTGNGCEWASDFHANGMDAQINALAVFDDGDGPALYAGGSFQTVADRSIDWIVKWDGSTWSPLGAGLDGTVNALTVFDDGNGAALYAGGNFTTAGGVGVQNVARWDGAEWSDVGGGTDGSDPTVHALEVFDDGGGEALYAGGYFSTAGGVSAGRIARWDGTAWSDVGGGTNDAVFALTVFDDGGGPALYAGGFFTVAGGVPAQNIAVWDGATWDNLGGGVAYCDEFCEPAAVFALRAWDDGEGADLYAGGFFSRAGAAMALGIARWDGREWSAVGDGVGSSVWTLEAFDDGGGSELYAGVVVNGTSERILRWNGEEWSTLDGGTDDDVRALAVFDDGTGARLHVAGDFTVAGDLGASRIATWDGSAWELLGDVTHGMNRRPSALAVGDLGDGQALYAGGSFTAAGGTAAERVAKWDGASWSALGGGINRGSTALALAIFDDGNGPALYAGGLFFEAGGVLVRNIAKWDGAEWSDVGGGTGSGFGVYIASLAVFDDGGGPALYAGGTFSEIGGTSAANVARWDGVSWTALGEGVDDVVSALTVFDDGSGPALYAGGRFLEAGGRSALRIARWDGTSWAALGAGIGEETGDDRVQALAVFDDGQGPALYAGGVVTSAGGASANGIARWDGAGWSPLGSGLDDSVTSLAVFDDGDGAALFAGGFFRTAGGLPVDYVARWNGVMWAPLAGHSTSGVDNWVSALAGFKSALFVGGDFGLADGRLSAHIARYGCSGLFDDGFETGDLSRWSSTVRQVHRAGGRTGSRR